MSAAAIIIRRQREIFHRFLDAEAITPQSAQTLEQVGVRPRWIFHRLAARGVVVEVAPDRWYLDVEVMERFKEHQTRKLMILTAVLLVGFAIWLMLVG